MDTKQPTSSRKEEIMLIAMKLFLEKGYDHTSISDLLQALGIARGTLYHHFSSKEAILDALIERKSMELIAKAKHISEITEGSIEMRILSTMLSLGVEHGEMDEETHLLHQQMHQPQNALMHEKILTYLMNHVPQIFSALVEEGIEEGVFHTPYPKESMEMVIIYLSTLLDREIIPLTAEERAQRLKSALYNLERLLGTEEGRFDFMLDHIL